MTQRHARPIPRPARALAAAVGLCLLLGGCGVPGGGAPARPAADGSMPDPDLVARNLVHTLAQLDELHPMQTTLQASRPVTAFGERVLARLEEAGYGLQLVRDDQGARYVRYQADQLRSEAGERIRYLVAIGPISVERDYEVLAGTTLPDSRQIVSGAPERELALNDDVFGERIPAPLSEIVFETLGEPALVSFGDAALPSPVAVDDAAARDASAAVAPTPPDTFGSKVRYNLFDRQASNYASVFADYEDIRQDSLIFDNDSLHLGEANKAVIAEYVRELDPATDVLSVIGCSHGNSAIRNGNALLALGRANRVKEAFMFAGLDPQQVLEESCWADGYHATFPKRGVVLTLKRLRSLG